MEETVKERRISYLLKKGLTRQKFCDSIGVSKGYVDNIRNSIQPDKIYNIAKSYPDLNLEWLLVGVGTMLRCGEQMTLYKDVNDVIMVPIVNLDARGGFLPNANCDTEEYTTDLMPFSRSIAKKGDIVVPIFGDSMAPKYTSGSLVLIRNVESWQQYLEYGATYVIELTDGRRMIKNIMKGEDKETFNLVSINPKYEPATIPKSIIRHVFMVILSNRRDSM